MVNNRLDAIYSALADPTRRNMLERLGAGSMSVSDLGAPYGMTLAAIGKHVTVLEAAGIVRTRKQGRVRSCSVIPHALSDARDWLAATEAFWNTRMDAMADYLGEREQQT